MKSAAIGYGDFGVDERTGLSAIATGNAPAVPDVRSRDVVLLITIPRETQAMRVRSK